MWMVEVYVMGERGIRLCILAEAMLSGLLFVERDKKFAFPCR